MKRILWGALVLSPVVWSLLHEPGADSLPGDASRPAPRRRPRISNFRSEPLDDAGRAEGEAALRCLQRKWQDHYDYMVKTRRGSCGTHPRQRFDREWEVDWTELRLVSIGYPEVVEGWAQATAEDPAIPGYFRLRAIWALRWLAEERWGGSMSVLLRLTRDPDRNLRDSAGCFLVLADREGDLRSIIRDLARDGLSYAIEAMGDDPSPDAAAIIGEGRSKNDYNVWAARAALTRIDLRSAGVLDRCAREAILTETSVFGTCDFLWALRACRARPWFERVVRERIDREIGMGGVTDELLVALAETGGRLTPLEMERLRKYGYAGDPRARLAEVLGEKGYRR